MLTIGRSVQYAKLLCNEAGSRYFSELGKFCVEDALAEFFSREWPFTFGEGVIATTPPYNTGTITATMGSSTITLAGGTWDVSWPVPAVLRPQGGIGEQFLVTAFPTTSTLTLDKAWPYTTAAGLSYGLEYPAYTIPDYIHVESVMSSYIFERIAGLVTYQQIMDMRRGWLISGAYPAVYCVIPGNGVTASKLWISPSPSSTYTFRYTYLAQMPTYRTWDMGTVTVANGSPTVTGSGTNLDTSGLAMVGDIFEVTDASSAGSQPFQNGTVQSVAGHNATLTSNWTGRTAANVPYCISPQILVPPDVVPAFRLLVESYVYARVKPEQAAQRRLMYQQAMTDAVQRLERAKDTAGVVGVLGTNRRDFATYGPGMPTELVVVTH